MNKMIPILLGVVCLMVVIVGWFAMRNDSGQPAMVSTSAREVPPLPAGRVEDTEAAKLQAAMSYSAQLSGATGEMQSLQRQVKNSMGEIDQRIAAETEKAIQRQLPALEQKMREQIRKETEAKGPAKSSHTLESNRVVDRVNPPANPAAASLSVPARTTRLLDPALAGVPDGLGFENLDVTKLPFDSLSAGQSSKRDAGRKERSADVTANYPGYIKIAAWQPTQTLPALAVSNPSALNPTGAVIDTQNTANSQGKGKQEKPKPVPIYTIENTSTLFANTTMTALMGVVPNKNNAVKNLMRFKLITGAENIASNGLYLPDVRNIVWTGYVIGNREMECVQATVDTVTFTFKDGTISTFKKKQGAGSGHIGEGLGYLSDRWGKPCLKGTLISNASQYLRDRMIAAGAAATASAAAATQTTTARDALGGTSTTVTGSQGDFILAQTGTATLNELAAYLRDRMDQAIDIVYLDAGKDVVIHVEEEIPIDYDPAGRKLSHVAMHQKARRNGLD